MTDTSTTPTCTSCGKPVDFNKPHAFEAYGEADRSYCTECTRNGRVERFPIRPERINAIKARRRRPARPERNDAQ